MRRILQIENKYNGYIETIFAITKVNTLLGTLYFVMQLYNLQIVKIPFGLRKNIIYR